MTVSYSKIVSRGSLSVPFRLFAKWRGSIFKVVYREALIYFACYAVISLVYRLALDGEQRKTFEDIVAVCRKWSGNIPVTFILGFYVTIVFARWRSFVENIPWIDSAALLLAYIRVSNYLHFTYTTFPNVPSQQGTEEQKALCKGFRRKIVRWLMASQVLCFRAISVQVHRRFPTIQHLVEAKLLSEKEAELLVSTAAPAGDSKHWLPIGWVVKLMGQCFHDGLINYAPLIFAAVGAVDRLREKHLSLLALDWVSIPLVYTQLVSLAVWANFGISILGSQFLHPESPTATDPIDLYVPAYLLVQFVCFVGWLRVAQSMLNPLGERDDDLELNFLIDRNLRVGMDIADMMAEESPPFPDDTTGLTPASELPYTDASQRLGGFNYTAESDDEEEDRWAKSVTSGRRATIHAPPLRRNTIFAIDRVFDVEKAHRSKSVAFKASSDQDIATKDEED